MLVVTTFLILIGTILATFILVPRIVVVARSKRLMDAPNSRSSHSELTPNLGGVAFFVTLMVAIYFIGIYANATVPSNLYPCLTVLLIVGLKDDLMAVSARTKFIAQFLVSGFILLDPNFGVINFHGFLGLHILPDWFASILVFVTVTGIINAINLIDGIDGLAASVGIVGLVGLSCLFYVTQMHFALLLCIAMAGCLIGFLPHNYSKDKKIFMGDTGSMIVGFVFAYLCITALSMPEYKYELVPIDLANLCILLFFFIFIPLIDTLRIMTVRIIKGRSPFKPDRTHLHHYFIFTKNFSHAKTTIIITLFSVLLSVVGAVLSTYVPFWANVIIVLSIYALSVFISIDVIAHSKKKRRVKPSFFAMLNSSMRSIFL